MTIRSRLTRIVAVGAVAATAIGGLVALTVTAPSSSAATASAPSITGIAARSGRLTGGQDITIRGYHLTGTTAVLFGSVTSPRVQVVSDTNLTVRTPPHAGGVVRVQVVTPAGRSAAAAVATFEYVAAPYGLRFSDAILHAEFSPSKVSCGAANFCAAIGFLAGVGAGAMVYNGSRWTPFTVLARGVSYSVIDDVSCTVSPTRLCVAIAENGYAFRSTGGAWSRSLIDSPPRTGYRFLASVSCASSRLCYAVDSGGNALRYDGSKWTAPHHVVGMSSFGSISCPTVTFCYATSRGTTAVRLRSGRWDVPHTILASGSFAGISCSSATFCMATGLFGYLVYTGLAWGPVQPEYPYDQDPAGAAPPRCSSPTFCLVFFTENLDYDYLVSIVNGDQNEPPVSTSVIGCWKPYDCLMVNDRSSQPSSRG